jgi:hypothetical protein
LYKFFIISGSGKVWIRIRNLIRNFSKVRSGTRSKNTGFFPIFPRCFHRDGVNFFVKNCDKTEAVQELIPEFYYLPEMFVNTSNYRLGQLGAWAAFMD